MCCSVKLSVVRELKSSPLMFYLCILQPPVSPPPSFSLISPVFGDKRELRVAVELQTGCHGDCQRLCVCMCVSHAIMEAVSEPRRLTVSCLSDCWRQNDQRCCFRTAICLTSCKSSPLPMIQVALLFAVRVFCADHVKPHTGPALMSPWRYEHFSLCCSEHDFMCLA